MKSSSSLGRNLPDANNSSYRVFAEEKIVDNSLAEQSHFCGAPDIRTGERLALLYREIANLKVVRRRARDLRTPVVVAINDLGAATNHWRRECSGIGFPQDRRRVIFGQRLRVSGAHADAGTRHAAREHDDQIAADGGDLLFDPGLGSRPDRNHCNHRRHPDDNG